MSDSPNHDDADFVPPLEDEFLPPSDTNPSPPAEPNNDRKWIIPVVALGCGCVCLPFIALILGLLGLGNTARRLYQSTGTYQVYQLASEAVETDARVIDVLGKPVEAGWTSKSQESYTTDDAGVVCMRFNVMGSDRSGSAYAEAQQQAGAWQLHQLTVGVNGRTEPLAIVPLGTEESPLCPDFDEPDSLEPAPTPEEEEVLPREGTEI